MDTPKKIAAIFLIVYKKNALQRLRFARKPFEDLDWENPNVRVRNQTSHEKKKKTKKKNSYFALGCFVFNRDPDYCLLKSPQNWVV